MSSSTFESPYACIRHAFLARETRSSYEWVDERLELRTKELDVDMLGFRSVDDDEGQVDFRLGRLETSSLPPQNMSPVHPVIGCSWERGSAKSRALGVCFRLLKHET